MSKIKELLNDRNSILVFDIDGVLAKMEFGENTHFMDEDEWNRLVGEDINFYTEDKVSKKIQEFLEKKDKNRIYVITKVGGDNELLQKREYVNKYYNILNDNVYGVKKDSDKVHEIMNIKEKYNNLDDEKIIMIDDTVEILNDIMEHTNFSTAHISSFLDM